MVVVLIYLVLVAVTYSVAVYCTERARDRRQDAEEPAETSAWRLPLRHPENYAGRHRG